MSDLPNPDTLERQPGAPSTGADNFDTGVVTPEDAAAEAKAAQESLRQERDASRRERDEALARERASVAREFSSREQTLTTTIQAQENIVAQAKRAIAEAQANGDPVAMTDAIEALSDAKASLKMLGEHKINLEGQKGRQPQSVERDADAGKIAVHTPGGTIPVTPQAKQWIDAHPRFYNDRTYYNQAVLAHTAVIDDGLREGSPAYFRELDARMQKFEQFEAFERGEHTPPAKDTNMNSNSGRRMSASAMGAPVSRQPAQSSNRSGTPDATTIARHLGCDVNDLRDFARINGYTKDRYKGDENAAFQAYLASHQEIIDIQRSGGDAGMRVDGVYR